MIEDVAEFQEIVLGNKFPEKPQLLENDLRDQTVVRIQEELDEFKEAKTINDQADALVDLMYFALGALHQAGVPTQQVFSDVHKCNMQKVKGITKRGDDNDAAKPKEWKAPDHSWLDELAKQ